MLKLQTVREFLPAFELETLNSRAYPCLTLRNFASFAVNIIEYQESS